tara:strand:- start:3880 stop:4059 length:180 start_codon:yes stop_codon:yes gene_type:complete
MGIVYLFRWISPYLVTLLFNRLTKKMGDHNPNNFTNEKQNPPKKKQQEMGEYIDYEEID